MHKGQRRILDLGNILPRTVGSSESCYEQCAWPIHRECKDITTHETEKTRDRTLRIGFTVSQYISRKCTRIHEYLQGLVRNEVQRLNSISVEHQRFSAIYPPADQAPFHKTHLFSQILAMGYWEFQYILHELSQILGDVTEGRVHSTPLRPPDQKERLPIAQPSIRAPFERCLRAQRLCGN